MPYINKPKRTRQRAGDHHDAERRKIYNTARWKRIRKLKFLDNPLCEICEKKGIITPAEDIHHITSFMSTNDPVKRYFLAYDMDNLLSLCKQCHQKVHNERGVNLLD